MADEKQMHYDSDEVVRSDGGRGLDFSRIVEGRIGRRGLLQGGIVAAFAASPLGRAMASVGGTAAVVEGLDFEGIAPSTGSDIVVPDGYKSDVLISWGDDFGSRGPAVPVAEIQASHQAKAFGYNNDFVGFLPMPFGSDNSDHGLLGVNHEYINPEIMFNIGDDVHRASRAQMEVCMEAVGFSVVEVKRENGKWSYVPGSKFNKRWTATSEMVVTGPARGDVRMRTSKHDRGLTCTGTFSNCSAGKTPWGTVLSAEENFQSMFGNAAYSSEKDLKSAARYGLPSEKSDYGWEAHFDRFDISKEPNEPYHFGWVVEVDPFDPDWAPRKRTALGRFRHEAATTHVTGDGRVVMYSGCDSRFEYVYKFVSRDQFDPSNRLKNRDLMDDGVLYVARFNEDGSGDWLPLIFGRGPLTPENGFDSQADVVIDARLAADLLGATKMDRPEDIEVNPVNERVYIACTNNTDRGKDGKEGANKMNPRDENKHGHVVELIEGSGRDHSAAKFSWELFLVCGDPEDESTYYAGYSKEQVSPISCPDNLCFDRFGNLWIATDGQEKTLKLRDGFFAVPTDGPERGKLKQFMASVPGSEVCGPEFTPDGTTAFLAIQHPSEGTLWGQWDESWPEPGKPPKPSIIAIQAENGAPIGSAEANAVSRRDALSGLLGR